MIDNLAKVKICHVTSVHAWNDDRIYQKMCISLAKSSNSVTLVVPKTKSRKEGNVEIIGIPADDISGRLQRILKLRKRVIQAAIDVNADIYHLHDPELLPYVKKIKALGKKVIYDSHENVPGTIKHKSWIKFSWLRNIIANLYNRYEKKVGQKCNGVISVLPNITNSFKCENLETIYNYPLITSSINTERSFKIGDEFIIIYHGGLTRLRGIKELCSAINHVQYSNVRLHLLGTWESEEYQLECENELSDPTKLVYHGQQPYEKCQEYLSKAHLGTVLLHRTPNYEYSLPVKLFEYVLHNMPVIMSNFPYWMEEFGKWAQFADPHNPQEIAQMIDNNINDYDNSTKSVNDFKKVVLKEKSWKTQECLLEKFYIKILNS